jgi:hypothetical protein
MIVSRAIELLSEEDPNSEIMIQWFTKEHVDESISDDVWVLAVDLFDKWDTGQDDFGIPDCIQEAKTRLAEIPT